MKSLIIRITKQMLNDKRSLALILVAPLLILSLLYLLLGESTYIPTVAVKGLPSTVVSALKQQEVTVINFPDGVDVEKYLLDKKAVAVVTMTADGINIKMIQASSVKTGSITTAIKNALAKTNPKSGMNISYIYGKTDATTFDSLGYMLLGVLSFFFVFIISGISFVRERTTGTMERLMLTPVSRSGVVAGYTLGFGIFATIQGVLIILFTKYILKMQFNGSVLLAILIMILLSFTAVSMGALVSIFANSEFEVVQFIPIILIPQIFFSGLIPIDTLPYGLSNLAYIMPVYYGSTGLEGILIKGWTFTEIWGYIAALCAFILILFITNVLALKKYRSL